MSKNPNKKSNLVKVISADKFAHCPEGEFINLWGVPFNFDGKNMITEVSEEDAKLMKAAGRVK